MNWDDPDATRLTARLRKYRDKLTTFLHKPELDGTNNAAERALRPAVVMRKITGGSRSESGAKAWSILASVMRTASSKAATRWRRSRPAQSPMGRQKHALLTDTM